MKHLLSDPRHWSLRTQARVLAISLITLVSVSAAEFAARRSVAQIRQEAGAAAQRAARTMADKLSHDMAERARDVLLLSHLELVRSAADPAAVAGTLEKLRTTLPAFAWIGMTDAEGQVIAATGDILLGTSIAERPVFRNGRTGLWVGDVHDAVLLAKFLPQRSGESVKFVDVAAPVTDAGGSLRGVLALHLSWQWADHLRRSVLQPQGIDPALELSVIDAGGKVLLAPIASAHPPTLMPGRLKALEERWDIERWSDGIEAVTSVAESWPKGAFRGLGWRVVARDPQAAARAGIAQVRPVAWAWSAGLGALAASLAWWASGLFAAGGRPVPYALPGTGTPRRAGWSPPRRSSKAHQVAQAVAALQNTLDRREPAIDVPAQPSDRDPVTGLWNRTYLGAVSEHLVQDGTAVNAETEFCVLCLGLNGWDEVNARYGQDAGNQVLVQVARRMRQVARQGDWIFRLDGDRFMVLLACPRGAGRALARNVATRMLANLQRPLSYRTITNLHIGGSAGAALWPADGPTLAESVIHAEEALAAAARAGRGQFMQHAGTG